MVFSHLMKIPTKYTVVKAHGKKGVQKPYSSCFNYTVCQKLSVVTAVVKIMSFSDGIPQIWSWGFIYLFNSNNPVSAGWGGVLRWRGAFFPIRIVTLIVDSQKKFSITLLPTHTFHWPLATTIASFFFISLNYITHTFQHSHFSFTSFISNSLICSRLL